MQNTLSQRPDTIDRLKKIQAIKNVSLKKIEQIRKQQSAVLKKIQKQFSH